MSIHKADVYWEYASFYMEARTSEPHGEEHTEWEQDNYDLHKYGVAIGAEKYSDDFYAKVTAYVDEPVVTEGKKFIVTHEFENPLGIIDFYAPPEQGFVGEDETEESELTLRVPYERVKVTVFLTGELSYDFYFEEALEVM